MIPTVKKYGFIFLLWFCSAKLFAQVLFIDADSLPPVVAPTPSPASLSVNAALVRFVPKGKEFSGTLPAESDISAVLQTLGKEGKVSLLYLGTRFFNRQLTQTVRFDATEERIAFSLTPEEETALTNRQFGLELNLRAKWEINQPIQLEWNGSFSWSNDLLNLWAGEKYLMFGMSVAKVLKPGLLFTEGGEDEDEPEQTGVNLRALFGKKKEAKKEEPVPAAEAETNVSFLDTDFQKVPLTGKQSVRSGEMAIFEYPGRADGESSERIFLLLQPIIE